MFLLGSGISKSISPAIHNKAFRELGLDIEYSLCDIPEDSLDSKLDEFVEEERVIGFNVTIPFKERIIGRITHLDPVAHGVGAINLVVISADRKKMIGYNTDVDGVVASLSKLGLLGRSGQSALILGSGGASRACIYALLNNGFDTITIFNRTEKRAEEVASKFSHIFPEKKVIPARLAPPELELAMGDVDLMINTVPFTAEIPFEVSFTYALKKMRYLDLNYRKNSPLLREARREAIPSIDGSLMLVEQAARSFEILTGINAPRKTMMLAAQKAG